MTTLTFSDKFIAYVDILGFTKLVENCEKGVGLSLNELLRLIRDLGNRDDVEAIAEDGLSVCPDSERLDRDAGFRLTQISDCVVISTEVSPLGIITLIHQCLKTTFRLLKKGFLCSGYITRGNIYHTANQFIGTGYVEAYKNADEVTAFKIMGERNPTPFVEFSPQIVEYVNNETDDRVRKIFSRLTISDGTLTVVSPFDRLMVETDGRCAENDIQKINTMRSIIEELKRKVLNFSAGPGDRSFEKTKHYLQLLDGQIVRLDRLEQWIHQAQGPFGVRATQDILPGLFRGGDH
jgi:hypothetical protein